MRADWFVPKNQKLSHKGLVLGSEMWEGSVWGRWDSIGVGMLGWRVRGCNQVRHIGGGGLGQKTKNQAMGAQFWLVKCGQAWFLVEGTLGWGTLGLR